MTTIQEQFRNSVNLRQEEILDVLPDFFAEDYPLLIKLFEYYFEYVEKNTAASKVNDLFNSRDVTMVADDLLQYIQRELLLGVDNFDGFSSQRDALRINSQLYNAKGSKYSLQQFFRYFYGFDPEIVYTKNNVFIVGESECGFESQRFITDDRLYQTFAVLIKTPISLDQWEKAYRLFVHPAGMYLGAQIVIEDVAEVDFTAPDNIPDESTGPVVSDTAIAAFTAEEELTALINN